MSEDCEECYQLSLTRESPYSLCERCFEELDSDSDETDESDE